MVNKIFCPFQKDFHDVSKHLLKPRSMAFHRLFLKALNFSVMPKAYGITVISFTCPDVM